MLYYISYFVSFFLLFNASAKCPSCEYQILHIEMSWYNNQFCIYISAKTANNLMAIFFKELEKMFNANKINQIFFVILYMRLPLQFFMVLGFLVQS